VTVFHAHSGWWFERLADGSVRIMVTLDGQMPNADRGNLGPSVVLPPGTWASVVAYASRDGENAETFQAAFDRQVAPSESGKYDSDGRPVPTPRFTEIVKFPGGDVLDADLMALDALKEMGPFTSINIPDTRGKTKRKSRGAEGDEG